MADVHKIIENGIVLFKLTEEERQLQETINEALLRFINVLEVQIDPKGKKVNSAVMYSVLCVFVFDILCAIVRNKGGDIENYLKSFYMSLDKIYSDGKDKIRKNCNPLEGSA